MRPHLLEKRVRNKNSPVPAVISAFFKPIQLALSASGLHVPLIPGLFNYESIRSCFVIRSPQFFPNGQYLYVFQTSLFVGSRRDSGVETGNKESANSKTSPRMADRFWVYSRAVGEVPSKINGRSNGEIPVKYGRKNASTAAYLSPARNLRVCR